MKLHVAPAWAAIALVALTFSIAYSQTTQDAASTKQSVFSKIDRAAKLSRTGDTASAVTLARQLFVSAGIPPAVADSLGFTARIASAEMGYRSGAHPAVREDQVATSINNLMTSVGAPEWSHSNVSEVRAFRMQMLTVYPALFSCQQPPDAHGQYKALCDKMGPMEAAYLGVGLIYQKVFNSQYQFTAAEAVTNKGRSLAEVDTLHKNRTKALVTILQNESRNSGAVLGATGRLFDDLSIQSGAAISAVALQHDQVSGRQQ